MKFEKTNIVRLYSPSEDITCDISRYEDTSSILIEIESASDEVGGKLLVHIDGVPDFIEALQQIAEEIKENYE